MFQRIKILHELGFCIILHTFDYNSRATKENIYTLKKWCESIYIYKRKKNIFDLFCTIPFIVISRKSNELLIRLSENNFPILFEGIHTTAFIDNNALIDHFKIVRTHNIESDYYAQLAKVTTNPLKKYFLIMESWKLKRYENKTIPIADVVLTISEGDKTFFLQLNRNAQVLLPTITEIADNHKKMSNYNSKFILYHGNLSVAENEHATLFLIKNVFSKIDFSVVIAGKLPTKRLQKVINDIANIKLVASPNENEMKQLIHSAHIHVLYSFQPTGVKLKLMQVLQKGKYCIANENVVGQLPIREMVNVVNDTKAIINKINSLMMIEFNEEVFQKREKYLFQIYKDNISILKHVFTGRQ